MTTNAEEADGTQRPRNTYWVIERLLLAGEYPGNQSPTATREKLTQYLDFGTRAFLDLTHPYELKPYAPTLLALAKERGIKVKYQRLSIDDMGIPNSLEWMRTIQGQLTRWQEAGIPAYVHCWGGVGRTGTAVACHLVEHGLSPQEALSKLANLWSGMSADKRMRYPQSPQTMQQVQFVDQWIPSESRKHTTS
jgi:hypothetical protein